LKHDRLENLKLMNSFQFQLIDIADKPKIDQLFVDSRFDVVIHLAAQAGVRHSIDNPYKYVDSNLIGFMNILEACRNNPVDHLIFASSSSVYGANSVVPFEEHHAADNPVSLYAATKKANEVLAHSYSALYNIPSTGLRFFTVYGPYGRPDMAYFKFAQAILEDRPIKVFNNGDMRRDFTYVDDIVESIFRLIGKIPVPRAGSATSGSTIAPFALYNIGNNKPERLLDFIKILEELLGKTAIKEYMPMQPGDVVETYASIDSLSRLIGFAPSTGLKVGLKSFVDWLNVYNK